MTEPEELHPDDVQHHLKEVQDLLARQKVVEGLVHRQDMPRHELVENLVHKQHEAGLRAKLDTLHPADIAYILEALPREERLYVWDLVKAERDGEILLEVSDAVRESLIETMAPEELKAAAGSLDADELADLAPDLPPEVIAQAIEQVLHRHYANWADEAIPALGGRTPLQAISTPAGLERVKGLLREYEEGERQQSAAQGRPAVSYQFLWDALGISR